MADDKKLALTGGDITGNLDMGANNIMITGEVAGRDIAADGTNQDAIQTLTGVAAGAEDLGIFTGSTIDDTSTIKDALQALETIVEFFATTSRPLVSLSNR